MLKKSIFFSIGLLLLTNLLGFAQKQKKVEYSGFFDSYYYRGPVNLTVGVNGAGYIGDLGFVPGPVLSPGFNVGMNYKVWPKTYFGGEFNYFKLGGQVSDTSGKISFNTTVYELIANCRFDFLDRGILFKNDIGKRPHRIRPYVTLGIGAVYFDPKATVTDSNFFKKYEGVSTSNVTLVLPASLGFAFYISKRFSVLTEFGYRYSLTDAFDGISKLGTSGKDSYVTASLKLQYSFHPFKKKRAKYVAPPDGYGAPTGGSGSSGPKDSTLNAPILPPGEIAPPATSPDSSIQAPAGDGSGQIAAPPVEEKPKELTEEEKKKLQEEKEQLEWEQSAQPKKKTAQPADKKKKVEEPAPSAW